MAQLNIALGSYAEASIASAATCNIGGLSALRALITGTTTITSFGTSANRIRLLRFAAALTLTYNATSLILPGGANITTAAGDTATAVSDASGNWRITSYTRAGGPAAVAADLEGRAAAWGNPIATATTGTNTLSFTNLSAYRELRFVAWGLTHDSGSSQNIQMRLSSNNGSSYDNTGYTNYGSAETTSFALIGTAVATATPVDILVDLQDFNAAAYKTAARVSHGRQGSTTDVGVLGGRFGTARVDNALRIVTSSGAVFNGGEFALYGRKG